LRQIVPEPELQKQKAQRCTFATRANGRDIKFVGRG
jgi:hypothetical protein